MEEALFADIQEGLLDPEVIREIERRLRLEARRQLSGTVATAAGSDPRPCAGPGETRGGGTPASTGRSATGFGGRLHDDSARISGPRRDR